MSTSDAQSNWLVETIAGFAGGFISTILLHPLDVIKTRLQVDRQRSSAQVGDSFRVAKQIIRNEGSVAAFYRGLAPNLIGNTVSWGFYFFCYKQIQDLLHYHHDTSPTSKLKSGDYFLAAGMAGALTSLVTNPIWVLKTRMLSTSASAPGAYPTLAYGVRSIYQTDGIRGFYRGLLPSLLGTVHGAVQFMAYEKMKAVRAPKGGQHTLSNADIVMLSSASKAVAVGATYPYQVVRARLQTYDASEVYRGAADVVGQTWRREGLGGFYRGLGPSLVRVLPNVCVTFLVYENARAYLPSLLG